MIMDAAQFWDDRYRSFPQLGSGPGSRGYAAAYKNRLIKAAISQFGVSSIADIGCGDLCWLDRNILESCSYAGFDISAVAIERAKAAYPSLPFAVYDVAKAPLDIECDLVVSFDVLIHQTDRRLFWAALANTLASIGRIGFVSYLTPPLPDGGFPPPASFDPEQADAGELERERAFCRVAAALPERLPQAGTAFHQSLPAAAAALRSDLHIAVAARYRYQTIYMIRAHSGAITGERAPG